MIKMLNVYLRTTVLLILLIPVFFGCKSNATAKNKTEAETVVPERMFFMTSSASIDELFPVILEEIQYFEQRNELDEVVYLRTHDQNFKSPEGYSLSTELGDLPVEFEKGKIRYDGWATIVELPSKWMAAFPSENLSVNSTVLFFYKREF